MSPPYRSDGSIREPDGEFIKVAEGLWEVPAKFLPLDRIIMIPKLMKTRQAKVIGAHLCVDKLIFGQVATTNLELYVEYRRMKGKWLENDDLNYRVLLSQFAPKWAKEVTITAEEIASSFKILTGHDSTKELKGAMAKLIKPPEGLELVITGLKPSLFQKVKRWFNGLS